MFVFNQFNVIKNGRFSSSMDWWIVKAICKSPEADQHHLWILHRPNHLELGVDWKDLVWANHKKQQVGLVKWQKESDIPLQILHLHYHRLQLTLRYLLDQEDQEEQKHFRYKIQVCTIYLIGSRWTSYSQEILSLMVHRIHHML